jgi:sortase A
MLVVRVLGGVGRFLVAAGVLLLLFTAYQIWGTSLVQAHTQSELRTHLDRELPPSLRHDAPPHRGTGPPQVAATVAAPADGQPVGVLRIPSIGVDQVVVQGIDETDLAKGPGHYPGTPLPGEAGNSAIAGHRTTWGHPFYDLNAVARGAPVYLTTPQGSFTYTTTRVWVVSPSQTSVLGPTTKPSITLTTCNPRYSAAQRLILRGVLTASRLSGVVGSRVYPKSKRQPASDLAGATSGSWLVVSLWGCAVLLAGVVVWLVARRRRHPWLLYAAGTPALLVLLYFFFTSVTPHLPASF